MSTLLSIGFALLVCNSLVGMVANGFFVLLICIDWLRSRKLSPTDLILCCLGLSRFIWLVIVILEAIMTSFFKCSYSHYMCTTVSTMWLFMNTTNLWFAAWLSALYFVKIAIFSHPVFLQVKQRFSGLVPWLLLGSVVYSATVIILVITLSTCVFSICQPYSSLSSNSSDSAIRILNFCRYFTIVSIAPNIIPIMLFLSSSVFLISSLWKHLRRVRCSGIDVRDLNTQVHLTAIKALGSFAVLYLSSFVAVTVQTEGFFTYDELHWRDIIFKNVSAVYPAGHAVILILINPKLKQAWVRMLRHFIRILRCHPPGGAWSFPSITTDLQSTESSSPGGNGGFGS